MPNVQGPDGAVIQFPDGMDTAAINAEMAKHYAPPEAQATSGMPSLIPSFLHGARQPIDAAAQLLARGVEGVAPVFGQGAADWATRQRQSTEAVNQQSQKSYDQLAATDKVPGRGAAEFLGNVAATAPLAYAMPGAAAPGFLARTGSAAASGGLTSALQPVDATDTGDFWKQKGIQAGTGAATGAGTSVALDALARLIRPNTSQAVKTLMDSGVTPTPGQILGGSANRIEEAATSIPLVGDAIKNARYRGVQDFNRGAINDVLAPIGETLGKDTPLGHEAVSEAASKVTAAYNKLLPQLTVKADQTFATEAQRLTQLAQFMPKDKVDQFNKVLQGQVLSKFSPNGTMTGETFKEVEEELGKLVSDNVNSSVGSERAFGKAVAEMKDQLRGLLTRSNPDKAAELGAVNTAYSNLLRVQGAAGRIGADSGVFTPAQLLSSVRQLDPSLRKSGFARGNAIMQDLAESGKSVLGNKVPDSGTPLRGMTAAGLGLGTLYHFSPSAALGGAAGGLGILGAYSPIGQKAIAALLASRPDIATPAAAGVRALAPASAAGAGILSQMLR